MFWKKLPWNQTDEEFIEGVRKTNAWRDRWGILFYLAGFVLCCAFIYLYVWGVELIFLMGDTIGVLAYIAAPFIFVAFSWQMHRVAVSLVDSVFGRRAEKLLCKTFDELNPCDVPTTTVEFVETTRTQLANFNRQRIYLIIAAITAIVVFFVWLFMVKWSLQVLIDLNGMLPLPVLSFITGTLVGGILSWKATSVLLSFCQAAIVPRTERMLIELCDKHYELLATRVVNGEDKDFLSTRLQQQADECREYVPLP